ncbi:MAG: PIN domain-containing protein [Caulobacteraceae bacterium]|nr:PIN domain-containing protein [Caulobacter sp.]
MLDTSAVLAILYEEEGAANARDFSDPGSISRVNVAEVLTDLIRTGYGDAEEALEVFKTLQLRVRSVYDDHVPRVAELKRIKGLSLGDCFCIALGETINEPLITADRQWAELDLSVAVHLIR